MNRSYSKIRHIQESNQILEQRKLDEQLLATVKKYVKKGSNMVDKGVDMVMGNTGNKFWDAANKAGVGRMDDGNSSNEKMFCEDGCENNITIFSDGRATFNQGEFDKSTPGRMVFNSDGSFYFKWNDGGKSQIYKVK